MAALALNHETKRELSVLDNIARRIEGLARKIHVANDLADEIRAWVKRFRKLRRVFEPLATTEDREWVKPIRAERVVKTVISNLQPFLAGVDIEPDISQSLMLPAATLAEWQGLFQNVITNALNAMIDSEVRVLRIAGTESRTKASLRISDTGSGIDLEEAERLFEPFQRKGNISEARKSLGLGGHGLGLTIVRMIAEGRRCRVGFIPPENGFSSTFELTWKT
jgi:C4-dicarboxylate-specific signal transduction histidine kinase